MTPTARTLKYLRDAGYHAEVVEKWNPHARRRVDLFGFGDIIALPSGNPCWLFPLVIQATTGANHAARVKKTKASPLLPLVKRYFIVVVVSWSKTGARGKRKTWAQRVEVV